MILQKLLRLKLIQLARTKLIFFIPFFLLSCFGPVKELKYQIEDSMDDSSSFSQNPIPLDDDFINSIQIELKTAGSFSNGSQRNLEAVSIDENIFYPSANGKVISFNINNNKENWDYIHSSQITAGLEVLDLNLFFVDYDGFLICLNLSGVIEWKTFVGEVFTKPFAINNSVIIKTTNNKFFSFNTMDGSVNWYYQLPLSPLPVRSWGEISYSDEIIYSGTSSGKVIAINYLNGLLMWETTYSPASGNSEIERSNDTTSKVIIDEYIVYAVSSKGNIAALSKKDGKILWKRPLSSFEGLILENNNLFVTHNTGSIYCIDKNSQKVLWRNAELLGRDVSRAIIYQNLLIVSDYEGYIHFLDQTNGNILARIKASSDLILKPLILNNKQDLLLISLNGEYQLISINLEKYSRNPAQTDNVLQKNDLNEENVDINSSRNDENILDKLIFWD